jgi:hypothetical protein
LVCRLRSDETEVDSHRGGQRLEDGAGLVDVGDGAVAEKRLVHGLVEVQVGHLEAGVAGHAEQFAGFRIHDDDGPAERSGLGDLRLEFTLDDALDVAVDRELDIATGLRLLSDALAAELDSVADAIALEVNGPGVPPSSRSKSRSIPVRPVVATDDEQC